MKQLTNPLLDPLVAKFYKALRKRANKLAPRAVRRTVQINRPLLTKLCHANLTVRRVVWVISARAVD